jgi:hypothetical protein
MNDSYFASGSYNETARQHVMCQEIGHTFGLDHQDESGADLNTCMDYANSLNNPSPILTIINSFKRFIPISTVRRPWALRYSTLMATGIVSVTSSTTTRMPRTTGDVW